MPLFPCPDCGRLLSTKAETCPQCGRPVDSIEIDPALIRDSLPPALDTSRARKKSPAKGKGRKGSKARKDVGTAAVRLFIKAKGLVAEGHEDDPGFIVLAGSQSPIETAPSVAEHVPSLIEFRNKLITAGILVEQGGILVLKRNHRFKSASAAAAVMMARSANGRIEWKTAEGTTLKELQRKRKSE